MTDNERLLLLILADAMRNEPSVAFATRQRIAEVCHAIYAEPRVARQSALQGGYQDADAYYDAMQADAASDAHSPGVGRVP